MMSLVGIRYRYSRLGRGGTEEGSRAIVDAPFGTTHGTNIAISNVTRMTVQRTTPGRYVETFFETLHKQQTRHTFDG